MLIVSILHSTSFNIMSFKDELKNFGLTTSVKGIPRALKNQTKCMTFIWAMAVVVFFGVACTQTSTLILDYLKYPKITTLSENVLNDPFPLELLVCNSKPLSSLSRMKYNTSDIPKPRDYFIRLNDVMSCQGCTEEEKRKIAIYQEELSHPTGYYQYLGREKIKSISHEMKDLIVECYVILLDGAGKALLPCAGYFNITQQPCNRFYNCYRLTPMPVLGIDILGVTLVSYVDNFDTEVMEHFSIHSDIINSPGLMVSLIEKGVLWNDLSGEMWLEPGSFNHIQYNIEQRRELPAPYNDCQDKSDFNSDKGIPFTYNILSCYSLCLELEVTKDCSCRDMTSRAVLDALNLNQNMSYCGDVALPPVKIVANRICSENTRHKNFESCTEKCKPACSYQTINHRSTSVSWPPSYALKQFYSSYIKGKRYEERFKTTWQETEASGGSLEGFLKLVRKNFIKCTISLENYRALHMNDQPKYTIVNLISQVGSILNLWSGITIMVVIELVELGVSFCSNSITKVHVMEKNKNLK